MFKSFSGFSVFNWGVEFRLSPTKPYVLLCSNVHSFILGVEGKFRYTTNYTFEHSRELVHLIRRSSNT